MKKRLSIISAIAAILLLPLAALSASDVTNAEWLTRVEISNNGTALDGTVIVFELDTDLMISAGMLGANATDLAMRGPGGVDVLVQPGPPGDSTWLTWADSMAATSSMVYNLYTVNVTGGDIAYFPGAGGMTITDNESMEISDNFSLEINAWTNTSILDDIINKPGAFSVYTDSGDITASISADIWVEVAPKLGAETRIYSMAIYNNKLYGGTNPNGKLYEWNDVNLWVEVAPKLAAETIIRSLAVYNGKLYGGTSPNGKLYEWNDVNAWVLVAPKLGVEASISSLAVYNGKLYGGTTPNGKLYEWNDVNLWVEVAPKLGVETEITSLAVYNGKLYGGTRPNGNLYEWNDVNLWVQVAPQLGGEDIFSMAVYNNRLYGGTGTNGKLYEWNDVNLWVEGAPQLGAEGVIYSMAVYSDRLYGGTGFNGNLYTWNDADAWVQAAPQLGAETAITAVVAYNSKLYGGTNPNGKLYEWSPLLITAVGVANGDHDIIIAADTVNFNITVDTIEQDTVALGGKFVSDNGADWGIGSLSTLYISSYQHSVNGTLESSIEWEYTSGNFTDLSGNGNDATPTYRTESSSANVTANITAQTSLFDPPPVPGYQAVEGWQMITENITAPGNLFTESGTNFLWADELVAVAIDMRLPAGAILIPVALLTSIIAGVVVFGLTHRQRMGIRGSLALMAITITGVMFMWYWGGDGVIPGWTLIPFGLWSIILLMWRNPRSPLG